MTRTIFPGSKLDCRVRIGMEDGIACQQTSDRAFVGISVLVFAASAALTIAWCTSMSAAEGMAMPGRWTMSMLWMRMPGQTWIEATASFLSMWIVMMAAMMLPSHVHALWRYRETVRWTGGSALARLTLLASLGYFFVWTLFGLAVFPLGVVLGAIEMQHPALARAVPLAAGVVFVIAGAMQLTSWKAHHLARCRNTPARGCTLPANATTAWREGMYLGLHCSLSCANLTAILLVIGAMDLRAMALVSAAITAERLAPAGNCVAQVTGAVVILTGLSMLIRASGIR
jgi:predicted metal-binding membrane protein